MSTTLKNKVGLVSMFLFASACMWSVDVNVTPPTLELTGIFAQFGDLSTELNAELATIADDFETQVETDETIAKYDDQSDLATGFANAGASSASLGMLRSAQDFKLFSVAVSTGAGLSLYSTDLFSDLDSADFVKDEGDIYAGIAPQLVNGSVGINLGFLVDGLRATAKFGYVDIADGTIADDVTFNSMSVGANVSYMLLKPKAVPLGLVRWRGLSVSTGLFYQRSKVEMNYVPEDEGYIADTSLTLGDLGLTNAQLTAAGLSYTEATALGTIEMTPEINAKIETSTYTVPIGVSTGVRLLVIDLSVGAGVDLCWGSGEVSFDSTQEVTFQESDELATFIDSTPGEASVRNSSESDPQFLHPHLMIAAGLALGPVRLEMPFLYYFDSDGNTFVTGVTLGIVW